MKYLPCCFYPSTTVVVDDDAEILGQITLRCSENFLVKPFTDPQSALDYIHSRHSSSFTDQCIQQQEEHNLETRHVTINLHGIYQHIMNSDRFHEISVIVVDYSMPVMNGFEFCQKLHTPQTKVIMLTGEADESQGLKAFNHNLISKFHRKGEANIYEHLESHIQEKQIEYFQLLSEPILNALKLSPDPVPSCMLDESLVKSFFQLLQSHDIAEFYLYSYSGIFLTMTYEGKKQWLVIKDSEEMEVEFQLAEGCYENDPTPESLVVLNAIEHRKQVPLFLSIQDSNLPMNKWGPFLADLHILESENNTYYYAFFDHNDQQLDLQTVTDFSSQ